LRYWADGRERVTTFPAGFYSTDAITDHAIARIKEFHASKKPFFVHVCYTAAHSPIHAKPADIAKYAGRYKTGWNALRAERLARQQVLGLFPPQFEMTLTEPEFVPWRDEPLKDWNENLMAVYAAMIDCVDQNIGRMLDTLNDLDATDNTIVLVLNDNGGCAEQAGGDDPTNIAGPKEHYVSVGAGWAHAQNTPLRRYKAWCHEGGIATPLVVRWPGRVPAGAISRQAGHVVDLLPTLVEIGGTRYPASRNDRDLLPLEGRSLVPMLRDPAINETRKLYWSWLDNRAMREGRWKSAWDYMVEKWELFDIEADRGEMHDLAAEQPERLQTMVKDWSAWAERTGAAKRLGQHVRLKRR
jgi:arylsulfatase